MTWFWQTSINSNAHRECTKKCKRTNKIAEHVTEIRPQLVCFWFIGVWQLENVHKDSMINVEILQQQHSSFLVSLLSHLYSYSSVKTQQIFVMQKLWQPACCQILFDMVNDRKLRLIGLPGGSQMLSAKWYSHIHKDKRTETEKKDYNMPYITPFPSFLA